MTSVPGGSSAANPDDGTGDKSLRAGSVAPTDDPRSGLRPGGRRKSSNKKPLPMWQETSLLVVTAVVLALIIKTFLMQAFYIPSGSMKDTLKVNDRILVQKVSYWFGDIHRGDIVVFDDPANWLGEEEGHVPSNPVTKVLSVVGLYPTGGHLVKRVIGVGGDTVECRQGKVEVNGVALEESDYVTIPKEACSGSFETTVPAGHLWVMGDNRGHSADSRVHTADPGGGFIPVDDVVGKVFVVVWPIGRWQFIHRPGTFNNAALDDAAGLISGTAPVGLALVVLPPLYRRLKNRTRDV